MGFDLLVNWFSKERSEKIYTNQWSRLRTYLLLVQRCERAMRYCHQALEYRKISVGYQMGLCLTILIALLYLWLLYLTKLEDLR